ncbi:MAG: rhamnulokinase, partial [Candidatus Omnitrophica bacterium]|nr:rhamnulokinase [Candidatus Omnitrophota bacterium]
YHLCGRLFNEYTLASTSQLMDMKTGQWSKKIFDKLRLPLNIMPDVIPAGTVAADLKQELADEFRCEPIPIIAVGSHDTASAVAAVPAKEDNWAYLSSGTWSLMGVEIPKAIINDKTFEYSFTNEGGVQDTIRLLKNIMGLWLIQESRRCWQKKGENFSYAEITELAESARPFAATIDPNNPSFLAPGNMPKRINEYLKSTSQTPIDDKGQLIRTILESLALYYRLVMERIEEIIGNKIEVLHMVGGGIQNELLCQFTANALGRKVITGPIEATASGNILMQAMAKGQINSLDQARELISKSFELKEYLPEDKEIWDKEYKKAIKLFS